MSTNIFLFDSTLSPKNMVPIYALFKKLVFLSEALPNPEESQAHKVIIHFTKGTLSLAHIDGHMPLIFKSVFKNRSIKKMGYYYFFLSSFSFNRGS